jgi:hypothetical protein
VKDDLELDLIAYFQLAAAGRLRTDVALELVAIDSSQCERDLRNLAGAQFPKTAGLLIL